MAKTVVGSWRMADRRVRWIVGEVCHFVDWIGHVVGAEPVKVYANSVASDDANVIDEDTVTIVIIYNDESIGTIHYSAIGDTLDMSRPGLEESLAMIPPQRC